MHILVTGGAGFIGSHVVDRFTALGHKVVVLDNLSTGKRENVHKDAELVVGDINDHDLVKGLFEKHRFEVVNHHAAQIDVRRSVTDPVHDARVNILGLINLLQAGIEHGSTKIMFASTGGAIYGEQETFPADEKHPTQPLSPYGISKLACENYLYFYRTQYGLQTVIMRYANVYGPRQNPEGEAGVVSIFTDNLIRGQQVTINGDGLQTRDYVYVEDVANANEAGLNCDESVLVNIGTGIETDVLTLHGMLSSLAGDSTPPNHGPAKRGELQRSVVSPELARKTLGWKPEVPLTEGLSRTYEWFAAKGT